MKIPRLFPLPAALGLLLIGCGPASAPPKPAPAPPPPAPVEKPLTVASEGPAPEVKTLGVDPDGCTWIQAESTVIISDNESTHQARAVAINQARIEAMQKLGGYEDVESRTMVLRQEGLKNEQNLVERMIQTTRQGRIIKEKIISKSRIGVPGICEDCRYKVVLQDCIQSLPPNADKDFRVSLSLSRTRFVEGDEAKITVSVTRDSYYYLYNVGQDWETSLLVPNEIVAKSFLAAGDTADYPDATARARGVKLIAQLPESRPPASLETIRVIATKVPLSKAVMDPSKGGYLEVLQRLNATRTPWVEDTEAFTIYPP